MKKFLLMLLLLLSFSVVLVACGDDADDATNDQEPATDEGEAEDPSSGEPVEGGSITGAMHSAPTGLFNPIFYTETYENNILSITHESLVSQNNDLEFIPSLASDWQTNDDQTTITFTLEEGVTWHDGEPFTANDVVYTYSALADPDYVAAGGVRTVYVENLLGYEEYNAGETDEFEGVTADDDYTVTFHFAEPNVNPLYYSSFPIIPEHVFADIPVADIPSHTASLDPGEVIGTGPFAFTDMVEREQYNLTRHEDYWQGTPYLEEITWRIVDQSVMTGLLETGEIDFIADPEGVAAADYETVSGFGNVTIIEQPDFGYQLMGFKLHHRTSSDVEDGVIDPDNWEENEKLADPLVRQAIAQAINRPGFVEGLLYGRGDVINSPIAPQFWAYSDDVNQNEYDPAAAEALLDEAGYVDVTDDGFREDPNGEEWILNLDYPVGNELRERSAPIIAENLEEIGIQVNLRQPKEFTAYAEELENDNTDWDLYLIGWSLSSSDPDPSSLWGTRSAYNYSRWNNPESDELMQDALSAPDAFEQDYRADVYAEWQQLYTEDLPAVILYAQNKLYAHNDRFHGVDPLPYRFTNKTHLWWVSE
ncbi:ABC transporter substrate-binding protein [Amphibacillus cookii]|uniref:ABC transporter substrate-binding protein n=1 Tax=Amphibacillus cookii TaxID=767787 RepID=UPI0019583682|nr:ABC transporter substrate-binding protein [Amphibacillus cookii]MBM7542066.1 peptide/nickel transport system substrate-binding protein [Amphibacillus cookii]